MMDVLVTLTNLAVVQMESPSRKDQMGMDVIARKPNSNVARTVLLLPAVQTMQVVHVLRANTDVVQMAKPMHKDHILKDAKIFRKYHKKLVALRKTVEIVVAIRLNTSLIWNMVVAQDSGTVDAKAMIIVSRLLKNVVAHVSHQLEKTLVICRKFMDHVLDTIRNTIMIRIVIHVHHLYTAVVWEMQTNSKQSKSVNNCASLINHYVSR